MNQKDDQADNRHCNYQGSSGLVRINSQVANVNGVVGEKEENEVVEAVSPPHILIQQNDNAYNRLQCYQ